jgi:hypothetical protein
MTERWVEVVGYEGLYEVSDIGRVRSLERRRLTTRGNQRWPAKVLKVFIDPSTGYSCVNLSNGAGAKKCSVHALVLSAFRGARPDDMEGCHEDGNRSNNALTNLRWDTRLSNAADRVRHGMQVKGERSPGARLTGELVGWIRDSGQSSIELSTVLGVASSTVRAARLRDNWGHL